MTEKRAEYLRLTFPDPNRYVISIGPGDHTAERWEISLDQLRSLVLDAMPKVLTPLE